MIIIFCLSFQTIAWAESYPYKTNKNALAKFTTDGCSVFPDKFWNDKDQTWLHCCVQHDIDYWMGGTEAQREGADEELKTCVADTKHDKIAVAMKLGVYFGGVHWLYTSWRWGYGWKKNRGYSELSEQEELAADQALKDFAQEFSREGLTIH